MTIDEIKEAVEVIKAYREMLTNSVSNQIDGDIKAFDMAVEAMEGEACGDCVSRQAVLDAFGLSEKTRKYGGDHSGYDTMMKYEIQDVIEDLPPVNPQRTGHWIEIAKYSDGKHKIECSECGNHIFDRGHANSYNVRKKYKYCPSCGAKMVEPQAEGSDKV